MARAQRTWASVDFHPLVGAQGGNTLFSAYRYNIAFLKGDQSHMNEAVRPGASSARNTHSHALVLARSGGIQQARAFTSRAFDL